MELSKELQKWCRQVVDDYLRIKVESDLYGEKMAKK